MRSKLQRRWNYCVTEHPPNIRIESRPAGARTGLPVRPFATANGHPRKPAVHAGRYARG